MRLKAGDDEDGRVFPSTFSNDSDIDRSLPVANARENAVAIDAVAVSVAITCPTPEREEERERRDRSIAKITSGGSVAVP
jgi:hypothetical protein